MSSCSVPECAALAYGRKKTCQVHEFARLAKGVMYGGKGSSLSCADCRHKLRKEDWIYDKPGTPPRHVRCEPVNPRPPRQQIKDAPKPLWETDDDATRDRGAA